MKKGIRKSGQVKNGKKQESDSLKEKSASGVGNPQPSHIIQVSTPTENQNTSTSISPSASPSVKDATLPSTKDYLFARIAEPITPDTMSAGSAYPINLSGQKPQRKNIGKKSEESMKGSGEHRCARCSGKGKVKEGWIECPSCKGKGMIHEE